jgi:carboxymethylenebutenolidase
VNVEFSDADHGFFCDARASYKETAAKQAWELALKFLSRRMWTGKREWRLVSW